MNPRHFLALCAAGVLLVSEVWAERLSALGRALPRSGIVDVHGLPDATVGEVLANEGETVEAGQPLARLSSLGEARAALARAEADVDARRKALARDLEIAAAGEELAAAELVAAEERLKRIEGVRDSEFVSPDQIDERKIAVKSARLRLLRAGKDREAAALDGEAAVRAAESALALARARLARAEVRSPIRGVLLKSFARPGATVGARELFKVGDTSEMIVVAEIYEADALKVKPGQRAVVRSVALPGDKTGRVESISRIVHRNTVETLDPNENSQGRVVEATIRLDDAAPLDRLVLLQVDVVIEL
jgi:HlyD family secretion protein